MTPETIPSSVRIAYPNKSASIGVITKEEPCVASPGTATDDRAPSSSCPEASLWNTKSRMGEV